MMLDASIVSSRRTGVLSLPSGTTLSPLGSHADTLNAGPIARVMSNTSTLRFATHDGQHRRRRICVWPLVWRICAGCDGGIRPCSALVGVGFGFWIGEIGPRGWEVGGGGAVGGGEGGYS